MRPRSPGLTNLSRAKTTAANSSFSKAAFSRALCTSTCFARPRFSHSLRSLTTAPSCFARRYAVPGRSTWNLQPYSTAVDVTGETGVGYSTVRVPCRSNGSITVDVLEPLDGVPFEQTVLYLPAGSVFNDLIGNEADSQLVDAISAFTGATIVRINYRAGTKARYPVPIHDVMYAYDWVQARILEEQASEDSNVNTNVGVCGQLLGGGLASMLALTENRSGSPVCVTAAMLNNPLVDWVEADRAALERKRQEQHLKEYVVEEDANPETAALMKKAKKKLSQKRPKKLKSSWHEHHDNEVLSAKRILAVRDRLFSTPNGYHDSFATPLHFFRTEGIDLIEDLRLIKAETEEVLIPSLQRKSRRIYPPTSSNHLLPNIHLTVGLESILYSQGEELLARMSGSEISKHLKDHGLKYDQYKYMGNDQKAEVDFATEQAQRKFQLSAVPGIGLWGVGEHDCWIESLDQAALWLKNELRLQ